MVGSFGDSVGSKVMGTPEVVGRGDGLGAGPVSRQMHRLVLSLALISITGLNELSTV